jgi:hypothetical protein
MVPRVAFGVPRVPSGLRSDQHNVLDVIECSQNPLYMRSKGIPDGTLHLFGSLGTNGLLQISSITHDTRIRTWYTRDIKQGNNRDRYM